VIGQVIGQIFEETFLPSGGSGGLRNDSFEMRFDVGCRALWFVSCDGVGQILAATIGSQKNSGLGAVCAVELDVGWVWEDNFGVKAVANLIL
jgi:hypothetical protein